MPKTEAFDQYSDEYDVWFESHSDVYLAEVEAIRLLLPSTEAVGMEVGIGSGKFAVPLGVRIGVEPSFEMAEKARALGLTVYPGVAESLPFVDGIYDYVLMVTTICFVDDVLLSFREAYRVLKPGGCLIIGLVDRDSELGRQYEQIKSENIFYRDATFFSSTQVTAYFRQAGFISMSVKQTLMPGQAIGLVMDGYGKGSFVAIRGCKPGQHDENCQSL